MLLCDRCGSSKYVKTIRIHEFSGIIKSTLFKGFQTDLCNKCRNELAEILDKFMKEE